MHYRLSVRPARLAHIGRGLRFASSMSAYGLDPALHAPRIAPPSERPVGRWISAFLTVRRLLYSNDSFHSFSSAEFCSAYRTLFRPPRLSTPPFSSWRTMNIFCQWGRTPWKPRGACPRRIEFRRHRHQAAAKCSMRMLVALSANGSDEIASRRIFS